jgi:hypothetical protein
MRSTAVPGCPPSETPMEDNTYARPIPVPIPTVAPIRPMSTASLKNIDRINQGFAPIAFIVPISFVLSFTDVHRVVTTPIAPASLLAYSRSQASIYFVRFNVNIW